jgi:hypothetical protein
VASVSFLTVEEFFLEKNYKENSVKKIYFKLTTVSFRALPMDNAWAEIDVKFKPKTRS